MTQQRDILRTLAASCLAGFLLGLFWQAWLFPPSLPPPPPTADLAALYPAWLHRQRLEVNATRGAAVATRSEAAVLAAQVSVLCALRADSTPQAALAVRRSWLRRCSAHVEYGRRAARSVTGGAVAGSARLQLLLRRLWRIMQGGGHSWLVMADTANYVILENLRRLVAPLNASKPLYLGPPPGQSAATAAGAVLSTAAVQQLAQTDLWRNIEEGLSENQALGETLALLQVQPTDTRDAAARPRFLAQPPSRLHNSYTGQNSACCSPYLVTFGGVPWYRLYLLEYMVNRVHAGPVRGVSSSTSGGITAGGR